MKDIPLSIWGLNSCIIEVLSWEAQDLKFKLKTYNGRSNKTWGYFEKNRPRF